MKNSDTVVRTMKNRNGERIGYFVSVRHLLGKSKVSKEMKDCEREVVSLAREKKVSPWFANEVVRVMRNRTKQSKVRKLLYHLPFDHSEYIPANENIARELKFLKSIFHRFWSHLNEFAQRKVTEMFKVRLGILKNAVQKD